MKRTVYNTIDLKEFNLLEHKVTLVVPFLTLLLAKSNFYPSRKSIAFDFLGADYSYRDAKYLGNFGIKYSDIDNSRGFDVYLLKTLDKGKFRFFRRKQILSNCPLSFIKSNLENIVDESMREFKSWDENDLNEKIELM